MMLAAAAFVLLAFAAPAYASYTRRRVRAREHQHRPHPERRIRRRPPGGKPGRRHDQWRGEQRRHPGLDGNDTLDGGSETDYIDGGPGIDTAANGETIVNVP
jgi:hypothetical protein